MDEMIRRTPWVFFLLLPILGAVVLSMYVEEKVFVRAKMASTSIFQLYFRGYRCGSAAMSLAWICIDSLTLRPSSISSKTSPFSSGNLYPS